LIERKEKLFIFILAAIQFAHILDFVIMMPLSPMMMREIQMTTAQFGILVSAYNLSAGILGILGGLIADRFDRKIFLIISFIGFILGTLYCGLARDFHHMLIARIIAGAFGGVITGVVYAIITDLIPIERRGVAMGSVMMAFSVASVAGVPIGLTLANMYNWSSSFYFICVISLLILIGVILHIPELKPKESSLKPIDVLKAYLNTMTKFDYLKGYLFVIFLSLSSFVIIPFISPYMIKNVGLLETDLKYIYLFGGLFTMFSSRYIGKLSDKFGALKIFVIVSFISILPIILLTHIGHVALPIALIVSTMFMSLVSGRFVPCMTMTSEVPAPQDRGAFMSLMNALRSLGTAFAALIGGFIVTENSDGVLEGYNFSGYLAIVLTFVAYLMAKEVNKINHAKSTQPHKNI
jgi:DHA1 family inner membrane transport protein